MCLFTFSRLWPHICLIVVVTFWRCILHTYHSRNFWNFYPKMSQIARIHEIIVHLLIHGVIWERLCWYPRAQRLQVKPVTPSLQAHWPVVLLHDLPVDPIAWHEHAIYLWWGGEIGISCEVHCCYYAIIDKCSTFDRMSEWVNWEIKLHRTFFSLPINSSFGRQSFTRKMPSIIQSPTFPWLRNAIKH